MIPVIRGFTLLTCVLATLILDPTSLSAQSSDQAQVDRTVRVFVDSVLAAFDYERLEAMVTPEAQFVEAGRFMDVAGFKEFIRQYDGRATVSYRLLDMRTRVRGSVAWTSYRNRGILTMNGEAREREWHEVVVLVRNDGQWLIDLVHSRSVSR